MMNSDKIFKASLQKEIKDGPYSNRLNWWAVITKNWVQPGEEKLYQYTKISNFLEHLGTCEFRSDYGYVLSFIN